MRAAAQIAVLLPYKERFCREGAGAVALSVRDTLGRSRFIDRAHVFGRELDDPFLGFAYRGFEPAFAGLFGRNVGLAERLCQNLHPTTRLIEIHNRPRLILYLRFRTRRRMLTLHLHNDPQSIELMKRTVTRSKILSLTSAVYCVSDFIRHRFVAGLQEGLERVHVIRNGVERTLDSPPEKENLILYVGRLIEEKGVLPLLDALAMVLPERPTWRALIVGAGRAGGSSSDAYERRVEERADALRPMVRRTGFLPHDEVVHTFRRAAIAVVPSLWAEPISRTALEALANGCALIASPRGGLAEVVAGRGLAIEPTAETLASALATLIDNAERRKALQDLAWRDFPFSASAAAAAQDDVRARLLAEADTTR